MSSARNFPETTFVGFGPFDGGQTGHFSVVDDLGQFVYAFPSTLPLGLPVNDGVCKNSNRNLKATLAVTARAYPQSNNILLKVSIPWTLHMDVHARTHPKMQVRNKQV